MLTRSEKLAAFAALLTYPTEGYAHRARQLAQALGEELPEAGRRLAAFARHVEPLSLTEQEESFTRAFDINPACALEIGWHLFGEDYARGLFLVRMRQEMRRLGVNESTELPDHVTHVLAVLAGMNAADAAQFVRACVYPAIVKMLNAFEGKEQPFEDVIGGLSLVLRHEFELSDEDVARAEKADEDAHSAYASFTGEDVLHEGRCHPAPELVPLQLNLSGRP